MKRWSFTIYGNQDEIKGNAIPKLRMTQRGLWTKQAKRYRAWAEFIRVAWYEAFAPPKKRYDEQKKPYSKLFNGRMDIVIYWANEKHGDAEGIFGSIADALFENDKHLDGSFVTIHKDKENPRVEVVIHSSE